MSQPSSPPTAASGLPMDITLPEAHSLITTFTTFLTVSIHNILFYRHLYPATTFLSARAYNLPVHQSRHPKVCSWVNDAVDAVAAQLANGNVDKVAVVIHAPQRSPTGPDTDAQTRDGTNSNKRKAGGADHLPPGTVLERWMFDVSRFPSWPGGADAMREYGSATRRRDEGDDGEAAAAAGEDDDEAALSGDEGLAAGEDGADKINWTDVEEQFRAVLRRLSYAAEKLAALPAGCSFTVAVELREEGQAPIGHPQPWIPSQPASQPTKTPALMPGGSHLGSAKTTPIRSVEAGPLFFECWVEEGKAKDALKNSSTPSS